MSRSYKRTKRTKILTSCSASRLRQAAFFNHTKKFIMRDAQDFHHHVIHLKAMGNDDNSISNFVLCFKNVASKANSLSQYLIVFRTFFKFGNQVMTCDITKVKQVRHCGKTRFDLRQ